MATSRRDFANYIFVVTHLVPYPPARGVELRIYKLLKWLTEEGHRVILVLAAPSIDPQTLAELRKVSDAVYWTRPALRTRIGARFPRLRSMVWESLKPLIKRSTQPDTANEELLPDSLDNEHRKRELCPQSLVALVSKLARRYRPTAVVAEYIFLTPCFADLPKGTLRIIDTIDVFSRKADQVIAFGVDDPYACTEQEERLALLKADSLLAIQTSEAEFLKALTPERDVLLVGMDFEIASHPVPTLGKPDTITVVASDNALNVHGLTGFLSECWPLIKELHPSALLKIVGKVGEQCQLEDPAVQYIRWVDNLEGVYREARVVINPTIAGTGLKIKSAEALAHGRPLVLWPHGADGLEYAGDPPYLVCRNWQDFGAAVVRLLESDNEARALALRALNYASIHFNAELVYSPLRARLTAHVSSQRGHSSLPDGALNQITTHGS